MASNDQKVVLPVQRSRGQSRQIETKLTVSDVGNENAQTNLPKTSTSSSSTPRIVKTLTPPSTSVSQSTSGVMTGAKHLFSFRKPFFYAIKCFRSFFLIFFCYFVASPEIFLLCHLYPLKIVFIMQQRLYFELKRPKQIHLLNF